MYDLRTDVRPATVDLLIDGRPVAVPVGATVAAAVLSLGLPYIRRTPVSGAPRLPYCMMGVCFDCLATIDGVPNQQACMVAAEPGMRVSTQQGARSVSGADGHDG